MRRKHEILIEITFREPITAAREVEYQLAGVWPRGPVPEKATIKAFSKVEKYFEPFTE